MVCERDDWVCAVLHRMGLRGLAAQTVEWLLARPLRIALILLVGFLVSRLLARVVRRSIQSVATRSPLRDVERATKRAATLAGVGASVVRIAVWLVAMLMVLDELGVNLGPVLAGASIVGVALGFGAQSLVKDFLSGFFILAEDQYGVGDVITVAGATGTVEEINLRMTRLRAADGTVWFVPNGEIRKVGNSAKDWSKALVDVVVPYDVDVTAASAAIKEEAEALATDPAWAERVLEPPEVLGIEALAAEGVTLRVSAKTTPEQRASLARALRARIEARLRRDGVARVTEPAAATTATPSQADSSDES